MPPKDADRTHAPTTPPPQQNPSLKTDQQTTDEDAPFDITVSTLTKRILDEDFSATPFPVDGFHIPAPTPNVLLKSERLPDYLPGCLPTYILRRTDILRERSMVLYGLGYAYLQRDALTSTTLSKMRRHTETKIFAREMDVLNKLLKHPWKNHTMDNRTLYLDQRDLRALNSLLESRRHAAIPAFAARGAYVPSTPIWGRDTNSTAYSYTFNDFEILGACFRREVEFFLLQLDTVCHFKPDPFFNSKIDIFGDDRDDDKHDESTTSETEEVLASLSFPRDGAPHLATAVTSPTSEPVRQRQAKISSNDRQRPAAVTPPRPLPSASYKPHAAAHSSSSRLASMFKRTEEHSSSQQIPDGGPPDDDRSDDGSDGEDGKKHRPDYNPRKQPKVAPTRPETTKASTTTHTQEAHFDHKLKLEVVPTWNGDSSTLARWILRINALSKKSKTVCRQLGTIVPQRLTGDAETWYYSLTDDEREQCEQGWEHLRSEIGSFYMNRAWIEKTRRQAMAVRYRETGHFKESPSQYFIRKRELLELVYEYSAAEIIAEIMDGAPRAWKTILVPRLYTTTRELQDAIKQHEEDLLEIEPLFASASRGRYSQYPSRYQSNDRYASEARVNAIGFSPNLPKPAFPKDDSTVSKRTPPDEKGARPCRHCGSGRHWDNECKYARQSMKRARVNFVATGPEDDIAQDEYDECYYGLSSDDEDGKATQDF